MLYRAREWIAKPPFGNVKEIPGFRQCSLRGMELVRGEWSLVALAHNIRKAWLFRKSRLVGAKERDLAEPLHYVQRAPIRLRQRFPS